MRLRPRGSSSDLQEARAIAERLERRAGTPPSQPSSAPSYVRFGGGSAPPPLTTRAAEPTTAHASAPGAPAPAARPAAPPAAPPDATRAAGAPRAAEKAAAERRLEAFEAEGEPEEVSPATPEALAETEEEVPAVDVEPVAEEAEPLGEPLEPGSLIEDVSPEAHPVDAGAPTDVIGAEALVEEPPVEASPVEDLAAEVAAPGEEWEIAEETAGESPLSELSSMVEPEPEAAPPPTWESLLASARELAEAQAAMLIGPDGELVAATDGWPAAGPAAIASRLLPMVAPKLTNPGAFVPVKLAGQVLSVWQIEVGERLVTVAILAEKALPVIVRPDVDELLGQGSLSG